MTSATKGIDEVKGKKVSFTSTFPNEGDAELHLRSREGQEHLHDRRPGGRSTTNKQKFKANKKTSARVCPKEGTLTGTFKGTSGGETVESELA